LGDLVEADPSLDVDGTVILGQPVAGFENCFAVRGSVEGATLGVGGTLAFLQGGVGEGGRLDAVQARLDVPEVLGPVDAVEGGVHAVRRQLDAGGGTFGRVRSMELSERVEAMEDSDGGDGGLPELVDRGVDSAGEKR